MKVEISKLIEKGESERVEFKTSLSEWKDAIKTLVAFSWMKGGIVIFGISNSRKILGVEIGKGTIEDLANNIKQKTDPKIYPNIKILEIENKNVILVEIGKISDEPVLCFGKAYKRVGKSTHQLSRDEYKRVILERHKEELRFDNRICKGARLNDIDEERVKWFLRKAKSERGLRIDEKVSIKEALMRLKLMRDGKLTNSAVLLFGKNPQDFIMQSEVRCARFKGTEPIEFIDMKVFGGSVIEQRDDAVEFVKEHIKLHAKIVDVERVEKWEYPIEAIREAITNAICHRDYGVYGNIQVRIFDDRLEIWNPGKLLEDLTIEELKGEHDSILRNPLIGKNFFLIKYIEQWGTGTNRIIKESLDHGLPEPIFEESGASFVVIFRKPIAREELLKLGLNERQVKAVEYVEKKGSITNKEYQEINNVSRRTATRDLGDLVHKRMLKRVGIGKRGLTYNLVLRHDGAKMAQKEDKSDNAKSQIKEDFEERKEDLVLNERQEYIIETIKSQGFIQSIDIQKKFDITRDTANRDFNYLIKLKLIKRRGVGKSTTYVKR